MKAVVVANGEFDERDRRHLASAELVIAADGGAATLDRLGVMPRLVIGDLDSMTSELGERLTSSGVELHRFPGNKDETDTELAVSTAVDRGADEVVLLGGLGGERPDHAFANVLLLAALGDFPARVVSGPTQIRALRGGARLDLDAVPGDLVSLLPVAGDAVGVSTDGLEYPLDNGRLEFGRGRGMSNRVVDAPASVALDQGVLLVVEITQRRDAR